MKSILLDQKFGVEDGHNEYLYLREFGEPPTIVKSEQPNWRELIAQGSNATSSYYRSDMIIKPTVGHVYYGTRTGIQTSWSNAPHNVPAFSDALLSDALQQFSKKLSKNHAARQSSFMGGVFLGEFNKTVRMLANPFKSAVELTRSYGVRTARIRSKVVQVQSHYTGPIRHKSVKYLSTVKKRQSAIHAINDSYLEYTYGMTPLVMDISNVLKELVRVPVRQKITLRTAVFLQSFGSNVSHNWDPFEPNVSYFTFGNRYKETVSIRQFESLLEEQATKADQYGLSLSSFVPTLWELMPYSFVIDYFTNIGDIINNLCYPSPVCLYGYRNIKRTMSGATCLIDSHVSEAHHSVSFPDYPWEKYSFQREYAVPLGHNFHLEVPSARQALNVLSLLLSGFRN